VAQQQLDRADIGAGFEHVNGEGVPQSIPILLMIYTPRKSATAITRVMEWQSN
jgi:hypothetical protein